MEVRFARSVLAQQITVVENFNPGAVTKIELIDTHGEHHEVYTNDNPGPLPDSYRTLEVKIAPAKPAYRTIGAVVHLNTAKVEGVNQLDAIGVADVTQTMVKKDFKALDAEAAGVARFDSIAREPGAHREQPVRGHAPRDFARRPHPVLCPPEPPGQHRRQNRPAGCVVLDPAKRQRQNLGPRQNMGGPVNTAGFPNGLASVSANGQRLLLLGHYTPEGLIPKGAQHIGAPPGRLVAAGERGH
ncbi:MAG: hypothetical protein WKG07_24030 [Hymenobacter sp.]